MQGFVRRCTSPRPTHDHNALAMYYPSPSSCDPTIDYTGQEVNPVRRNGESCNTTIFPRLEPVIAAV
jgi:hypothetical protein